MAVKINSIYSRKSKKNFKGSPLLDIKNRLKLKDSDA